MEEYMSTNQALWDEWALIHEKSEFYDLEGFKAGKLALDALELEGVGDVTGKSLLHLQCHFGMSTLSWARLGAEATGVDFSERAITLARSLSEELAIPATFIQSNIYDLPETLDGEFDVVFTSYGVLPWLPDMQGWAEVVAHFLKTGGLFYIVEAHPIAYLFEENAGKTALKLIDSFSYFHKPEPIAWETGGSYADPDARVSQDVQYEWQHSMGDIINALIGAGLRLVYLREYPYDGCVFFPSLIEKGEDGLWRFKDGSNKIPLTFAIKATK